MNQPVSTENQYQLFQSRFANRILKSTVQAVPVELAFRF